MTETEFKNRVLTVAKRAFAAQSYEAGEKIMREIEQKLAADKHDNLSVTFTLHLGTLEAIVRSADVDDAIPGLADLPVRLEGSE